MQSKSQSRVVPTVTGPSYELPALVRRQGAHHNMLSGGTSAMRRAVVPLVARQRARALSGIVDRFGLLGVEVRRRSRHWRRAQY